VQPLRLTELLDARSFDPSRVAIDRHSSTPPRVERFEAADLRPAARSTQDRNGETVAADCGIQRDRDLTATGTLPVAPGRTTGGPVLIDKPLRANSHRTGRVARAVEATMRLAHPPRIGLPLTPIRALPNATF
jgi:hypothetical protein